MCFSYAINFSANALQSKLQLGDGGSNPNIEMDLPWEVPTQSVISPGFFFSGFDRPQLPVITLQNKQSAQEIASVKLSLMQWGLIPSWCVSAEKAHELSAYGLNARSETINEKPMFKEAWKQFPCLVPASGFFEWQEVQKKKYPHYIYGSDGLPLLMAGLYSIWVNPDTGEALQSYSIVTTEANALMQEIHNVKKRMPVIVEPSQAIQYLNASPMQREMMLNSCENSLLQAHPVANWLNNVRVNRNVESALNPVEKDFPQTLF